MAATTTAKKTTKKTAAKATAKKTTKKTAAKKATAKKAAPKRAAEAPTPRLRERELRTILEDAGYATAGLVGDVVELARDLPSRLEHLRAEAGEAPTRLKGVREVPERVEETISELRERLAKDTDRYLVSFEGRFDSKAEDGRKLADEVRKDDRVSKLLDQADNARAQLRGALTSVTKTADVAVETASEQADKVGTQAKATVTTARKGVDATVSQAKGTATAAKRAAEETVEATEPQARTARSQVKGATTSVRKTAEAATDAATDTTTDATE